eukprot:g2066.t1
MDISDSDYDSDESALSEETTRVIECSLSDSLDKYPPCCVVCRLGNNSTASFPDYKALLQHALCKYFSFPFLQQFISLAKVKAKDEESRKRRSLHQQLADLVSERVKESLPMRKPILREVELDRSKNVIKKSDIRDQDVKRSYDKIRENRAMIDERYQEAADVRKKARIKGSKILELQTELNSLQFLYQKYHTLVSELSEKAREQCNEFEKVKDEELKKLQSRLRENTIKLNTYAEKFNRQEPEFTEQERITHLLEIVQLTEETMSLREKQETSKSEMQEAKERKTQMQKRFEEFSQETAEGKRKYDSLLSKDSELGDFMIKEEPLEDNLELTVAELNRLGIKEPCSNKCLNCGTAFHINGEMKKEAPGANCKDTRRAIVLLCGCIDFCCSCVHTMGTTCGNCGGTIDHTFPLGKIYG